MAAYFIVSVQIGEPEKRAAYEAYIAQVRPIVEGFGGRYIIRSEKIDYWAGEWRPDRVIVVEFADRAKLDACFTSPEYRAIAPLREGSVAASALIVEV